MVAFGCPSCVRECALTPRAPDAVGGSARRPRGRLLTPLARPARVTPSACANHVTPSEASLLTYMEELRPRMTYLAPASRRNVLAALEVATQAHEGQKRKSGEPFIIHPIAVAAILADMRMDRDSVIAGLLHDTVEDTCFTLEEVEDLFGRDVRTIVEGETKFSKLAAKVHGQSTEYAAQKAAILQQREQQRQRDALSPKSPRKASATEPVPPGKKGKPVPSTPVDSVGGLVWARERDQKKREESQEKQADNLRAMFQAMTEDVRVIIVKLADRLHNMRTLEHMSPAKQKEKARETLEFFAPLAHRLGMRRVKSELEELSFRYLHPEEYRKVMNEVEALKRRTRFAHAIAEAEVQVREVLESDAILGNMTRSVEVHGDTKELYSVYRRLKRGETLSSMLDIATLTVVVDIDPSIKQGLACYHVLGRLHALWTPLPKRLKDYIAFPKPNGYQSLHTTVLLNQSQSFLALEIQIRTAAMHRIAEEGIAAELFSSDSERNGPSLENREHLSSSTSYLSSLSNLSASGVSGGDGGYEWRRRTKHWLRCIRDYIEQFSCSIDCVDAVRRDLLGNRVFVFTPGRNIVDLILGSTPVDLAYAIHSDVGDQMIGAKVNGRMVGLNYKLQNADVVKIVTSDSAPGPTDEWLNYAKSRPAKQKIRKALKERAIAKRLDTGRDRLAELAHIHHEIAPSDEDLKVIMPQLRAILSTLPGLDHIRDVSSLLHAVSRGVKGSGNLSLEETVLTLVHGKRRRQDADGAASERKERDIQSATELDSADNGLTNNSRDMEQYGGMDFLQSLSFSGKGTVEESDVLQIPGANRLSQELTFIELGSCCHPIYGDEVRGIRMRNDGSGVRVHRSTCNHVIAALGRPDNPNLVGIRWINQKPSWEEFAMRVPPSMPRMVLENGSFAANTSRRPCQPGRIAITARDCDGLLSYVTGIVAGLGKSIRRSCTETNPETLIATLAFEVLVEDVHELGRIIRRLKECDEVETVRRVGANQGSDYFPSSKRRSSRRGSTSGQAKLIEIVDGDSHPDLLFESSVEQDDLDSDDDVYADVD